MKSFAKKVKKVSNKIISIMLAFILIAITLPSIPATAASGDFTGNPAFRVIAYDTSARIEMPYISGAASYSVYYSTHYDADLSALGSDSSKTTAFTGSVYKPTAYALSLSVNSTYYFYLVTNDGHGNDTLQSVFEAKTWVSAKYWTDDGNYNISWYTDNPGATSFSISSPAQLAGLAVLVNGLNGQAAVSFFGKTVHLTASLDMSAYLWTPIGTATSDWYPTNPFKGTFDGENYIGGTYTDANVIKGLCVNNGTAAFQGLFGFNYNGTIENIGVVDGYIKGQWYTAGIVGENFAGTVSNCFNTSTVIGTGSVAGVAGNNEYDGGVADAVIINCYNTGSITGTSNVGGVAGTNRENGSGQSSSIINSYNTGSVTGTGGEVGGVVGYSRQNGKISNCYNSGTVSNSSTETGGIAGLNWGAITNCYNIGSVGGTTDVGGIAGQSKTNPLTNCYNTGAVSGTSNLGGVVGLAASSTLSNSYSTGTVGAGSNAGGVVGSNTGATVTNTYFLTGTATSGIGSGSGNATAESSASLKGLASTLGATWITAPTTFAGGVFSSSNPINLGYPVLQSFGYGADATGFSPVVTINTSTGAITVGTTYGDGTSGNPYLISNVYQLDLARSYYSDHSKNFQLTGNIDISPAQYGGSGDWKQFSSSTNYPFACTFDGNGFSVSGIYINTTSSGSDYSLLGCISGTVKNLGVTGGSITAVNAQYVSGVAAYNSAGTISNCYNTCTITGGQAVAGVVGSGSASGCFNAGTVSVTYTNGGGVIGNGSATNCYNLAAVNATANNEGYIGGVVGSGSATESYNTGAVTVIGNSCSDIGGVTGYTTSTLSNCYNTGSVLAPGSNNKDIGGVAGFCRSFSNCYNTGSVTGVTEVGGVAGWLYVGSASNSYNTGVVNGTSYVGGVVGKDEGTVSNTYFYGCAVGVGGTGASQTGTLPFAALASSSIKAGGNTTVSELSSTTITSLSAALGADFNVTYANPFTSSNTGCATVSALTVAGMSPGSSNIAGSFTITQNGLTASGFNGSTRQSTFSLSMPLTVTQATPAIVVSPLTGTIIIGNSATITATISAGYNPTGTVTFYNNGTPIGSPTTISGGVATISYSPTTTANLYITATYNGDPNNATVTSSPAVTAAVSKCQPVISLSPSPVSPGAYRNDITFTATLSNVYPSVVGKNVIFTVDGTDYIRSAGSDGVATYTLMPTAVKTYNVTASFAADTYNNTASSSSIAYDVGKGTQTTPSIGLSGGGANVTYGYSNSSYKATASGGESSGTYQYRSSNPSVVSINSATGALTVTGAGSATIYVKRLGDTNYNDSAEASVSITVSPQTLDATITPNNKQYDGNPSASVSKIIYLGKVGSDDIAITGGNLAFNDKTAGDNKTVTSSGYNLSGTKVSNYTLGTITVNNANITKAPLTVTNITVKDKAYDGTTSAAFTAAPALLGIVSGDSVTLSNGVPTFKSKNYSATPLEVDFTAFAITGPDAGNYTLTQPSSVTANITKETLSVSVSPVSIECGQAIPTLTVNVSGFAAGENASNVAGFSAPVASQNYGSTTTPVTGAQLNVTYAGGNATNNYVFSYGNSTTLTIKSVASGNVNILPTDIENHAPSADLQDQGSEISQAALTDTEQQQLASGSDISIYLRVKKIDAPQADQDVVSSALNGQTLAQYLDVSLIKKLNGIESNISQTSRPLKITFAIPDNLRASGRTFSIIRAHDGVPATLPDLDSNPDTITIKTDRFSTYAIVYTNSGAQTNPKAGDKTPLMLFALLAAGSLTVMLIIKKRRYKCMHIAKTKK